MLEKSCVLALLLLAMLAADWRKIGKASGTGKVVYFLLSAAAVYCGLLFVLALRWPNYTDLLQAWFGGAARSVIELVKTPS